MAEHTRDYLTTKELAELLRIKERKVYDLASSGEIPCSRAMGKLLFPRADIEAWLGRHASGYGARASELARPAVIVGSHEPLLEWALREAGSGVATFLDGSLDGLERFADGKGIAAGLHLFAPETGEWNRVSVAARFTGQPVVLIEWAQRARGIITPPENPKEFSTIADLRGCTVVPRQAEAGAQILFEYKLAESNLTQDDLTMLAPVRSEAETALAVLDGKAEAAFGLACLAKQYGLGFVDVVKERYDLLVMRHDWFEPPFQALLAFCDSKPFQEKAAALGGYDVTYLGRVHFNG